MNTFKLGQQAERVGMYPTPSVIVAEKGIVLEEICNQHTHNISKEYANYKGNTLFHFPLYHFITSPYLRELDCPLYIIIVSNGLSINKEKNRN